MMKKASGEEPVLWSNAIIGFGKTKGIKAQIQVEKSIGSR